MRPYKRPQESPNETWRKHAPKGKRPKQPPPAPSFEPLPCVTLNVDCAERSGYSIWINGSPSYWGTVDMLRTDGAEYACRLALATALARSEKAVLVFERPFRGTTQGGWIGAWKRVFHSAGGRLMLGVYPATWRARVLGPSSVGLTRLGVRALEQQAAPMLVASNKETATDPDIAPALLIGKWSSHAGEVAQLLQRGKRKA